MVSQHYVHKVLQITRCRQNITPGLQQHILLLVDLKVGTALYIARYLPSVTHNYKSRVLVLAVCQQSVMQDCLHVIHDRVRVIAPNLRKPGISRIQLKQLFLIQEGTLKQEGPPVSTRAISCVSNARVLKIRYLRSLSKHTIRSYFEPPLPGGAKAKAQRTRPYKVP